MASSSNNQNQLANTEQLIATVPGESQDTLDRLTELLIGFSQSDLKSLHAHVEDREGFVDHVSDTLGEAVAAAADDIRFQSSMAPVVAGGVMDTARREPVKLGEAIAPAMGPAIRGMIQLALADINERIEATVQQSFSVAGLKWRLEAKRTGTPLADIVLRETLTYRVDYVLLLHRQSGTLLCHASQPDTQGKDPAVVSAMLSAVGEFVADAFRAEAEDTGERRYQVGDLAVTVQAQGDLAIAGVVRGTLTSKVTEHLNSALERLNLMLADAAAQFDGDVAPFAVAQVFLADCLIKQSKSEEISSKVDASPSSAKKWLLRAAGAAALATFMAWFWQRYEAGLEWQAFVDRVEATPGYVVLRTDDVEINGRTLNRIVGMYDASALSPDALTKRWNYSEVHWSLTPFWSLEPAMIEARARKRLRPPIGVDLKVEDRQLIITGHAPQSWVTQLSQVRVTGVEGMDTTGLRIQEEP